MQTVKRNYGKFKRNTPKIVYKSHRSLRRIREQVLIRATGVNDQSPINFNNNIYFVTSTQKPCDILDKAPWYYDPYGCMKRFQSIKFSFIGNKDNSYDTEFSLNWKPQNRTTNVNK